MASLGANCNFIPEGHFLLFKKGKRSESGYNDPKSGS